MRKWSWLAVILAVVAFVPQMAMADAEEAKSYATQVGDDVLAILDDTGMNNDQKLSRLQGLFLNVVDVQWVGRFVLGKHWRTADEAQREAYLAAYQDFLIKHYTSRFAEYSGETFTVQNAEPLRKGEYRVRMHIERPKGQEPVIVDYMLREHGDSFKAFDIIVEGVSLISTQRSEFGAVVERQGMDKLTEMLKNKTAQLTTQTKQELAGQDGA